MKISYSSHLKQRIRERNFPLGYPQKVFRETKEHLFDIKTGHNIAISKLNYAGKVRSLVVSYDIIGEQVELITIHPISNQEIENKIKNGRWKKL